MTLHQQVRRAALATPAVWREARVGGRALASSASTVVEVDDPFTREVFATVELTGADGVGAQVAQARVAQTEWKHASVADRVGVCDKFLEYFRENESSVTEDITGQMGKPLSNAKSELGGLAERARAMMDLAPAALAEYRLGATPNNEDTEHFHRAIVREPVGVVLTLAPWNFPLLTAVNSVVPAVLAGNAVLVNHGFRTPLMSEHFERAFRYAGVPTGLVQSQKCSYETLHASIRGGQYDFVSFTGSVPGGRLVNESVGKASNFIDATLELGGNDAAYVAEDADLGAAVATVVDGGLYNAGQSCCGIERAFVHEAVYDEFVERARAEVLGAYGVVGDPREASTNMGPMAQPTAIPHLQALIADATAKGARVVVGGDSVASAAGPRLFNPTLLADCDGSMEVMVEESFGPLIAIHKVATQQEAVAGINASKYGLTSVIFTNDVAKAKDFANNVEAGTIFMNRADYLDPYMPWSGRKDTGKGVSLSHLGFGALTRVKNHHFKFLH